MKLKLVSDSLQIKLTKIFFRSSIILQGILHQNRIKIVYVCLPHCTLKLPSDWKITMILLCKSRIQINNVQANHLCLKHFYEKFSLVCDCRKECQTNWASHGIQMTTNTNALSTNGNRDHDANFSTALNREEQLCSEKVFLTLSNRLRFTS